MTNLCDLLFNSLHVSFYLFQFGFNVRNFNVLERFQLEK